MRKKPLLLTFFLCLAAIILLVGCNTLDSVLKEGGNSAPLAQILNKIQDKDPEGEATPIVAGVQQGETIVKLYFADSRGEGLIEVKRSIPKTLSLARETVNQWLSGPVDRASDAYAAVNPQTVLRDININNGVAIVDLSKQFLQKYSNVSPQTTLYGLVNTLTQFPTVEIVKIRVEGQEIDSYFGIDLTNLRMRPDLIRSSTGSTAQEKEQSGDNPAEEEHSPSSVNIFGE